jgi:hypothetical protein
LTPIAVGALASLLAGCVYSVHPVLRESDLVDEFDLTGTWEFHADGPEQRSRVPLTVDGFSDGAESQYDVQVNEQDFVAEIGKLGDEYYLQFRKLDLTPEAPPLLTAVPVYGIARIEVVADELRLYRVINRPSRAVALMKASGIPFITYRPSNEIEFFVLTGPTESLQDFIRQTGDDLFEKTPLIFKRVEKSSQFDVDAAISAGADRDSPPSGPVK